MRHVAPLNADPFATILRSIRRAVAALAAGLALGGAGNAAAAAPADAPTATQVAAEAPPRKTESARFALPTDDRRLLDPRR